MPRSLGSLILAGLLLASPLGATEVLADDPKPSTNDFVSKALAREIIGPRQTLAETIRECESAIPRMPELKSVGAWEKEAEMMRSDALTHVIFRGEASTWCKAKGKVEWLDTLEGGPGYRIRKLRYEALPGLWIPALLYEPESMTGKVPVVLNVNGHDANGKAADYKQVRCINLAKRGMLALNIEWFGMGQFRDGNFRHDLINHIDLCGAGGIATHYLTMSRGLDLLLALDQADPERVAVTGLSGGGWQTIFISAFDKRVTLTNPVAGYSSFLTRIQHFSDLGDAEQTPCDLATVTDYAHMTAMMAPRATLLTFNAKDNCCFAAGHALPPLLDAAAPVFRLYGQEPRLRSHVNTDPGTHNYLRDNREAFYGMVGDTFFKGDAAYSAKEISADAEIKPAETLNVALPGDQVSLHSLALSLSKPLPNQGELPVSPDAARAWRDSGRKRLRDVVRARQYETKARSTAREQGHEFQATFWRVEVGDWSVPVVELTKGNPSKTVILLADDGRQTSPDEARKWLSANYRVLAVDPFYVGEAKVAERDYLFALMLSTVGNRPLGVQASQLAAIARWAKTERPAETVTLASSGPRTGTMALVAAALEEAAIDDVVLRAPLGSLKELIETKQEYRLSPELFCFGLLQEFDVAQLAALVVPRKVTIHEPNERARKELGELGAWYKTWGADWEPLASKAE
ncbi:acetylxylan esterase [Singulisphaera sp. Ch08]|uniref:Acetylxylan esterase n=1 Tax=Singulisphaera sp. Ch08 TaxID=3120278 RepID=A0AAU7CPT0_9BACT